VLCALSWKQTYCIKGINPQEYFVWVMVPYGCLWVAVLLENTERNRTLGAQHKMYAYLHVASCRKAVLYDETRKCFSCCLSLLFHCCGFGFGGFWGDERLQ
jgi:hypothetical protein